MCDCWISHKMWCNLIASSLYSQAENKKNESWFKFKKGKLWGIMSPLTSVPRVQSQNYLVQIKSKSPNQDNAFVLNILFYYKGYIFLRTTSKFMRMDKKPGRWGYNMLDVTWIFLQWGGGQLTLYSTYTCWEQTMSMHWGK